MSQSLKTNIFISLKCGTLYPIDLTISNNMLDINYNGKIIWHELIDGPTNMFGLESCQHIAQIIRLIDMGDDEWLRFRYIEK